MKIEILQRREGGSIIPMPADGGTVEYHFRPRADGAHVCDVEDDDHVERLLAITEGFREATLEGKPVKRAPKAEKQTPVKPSLRIEPPEGFPRNMSEMSRAQLLDYAKQVGVPGDVGALSEDMLRLNIQSTLDVLIGVE